MAVRLLRWLATPDAPAAATLYEALHRHVQEDGWVDRARLDIFAGDIDALARIPVQATGTEFQCRVWAALQTIPPGTQSFVDEFVLALARVSV